MRKAKLKNCVVIKIIIRNIDYVESTLLQGTVKIFKNKNMFFTRYNFNSHMPSNVTKFWNTQNNIQNKLQCVKKILFNYLIPLYNV